MDVSRGDKRPLWFFCFLYLCLISAGARLSASTQTAAVRNPVERTPLKSFFFFSPRRGFHSGSPNRTVTTVITTSVGREIMSKRKRRRGPSAQVKRRHTRTPHANLRCGRLLGLATFRCGLGGQYIKAAGGREGGRGVWLEQRLAGCLHKRDATTAHLSLAFVQNQGQTQRKVLSKARIDARPFYF